MRAKRILHTVARIRVGGVNSLLLQNLRHMRDPRLKHFVAVMQERGAPHLIRRYEALGYPPIRVGHSGAHAFPVTLGKIVRLLNEYDIDLIHSHHPLDRAYFSVASAVMRRTCVASIHDNFSKAWADGHVELPSQFALLKRYMYDKSAFSGADAIVAVSESVRDSAVKWRPVQEGGVSVLHNGIDTDAIQGACDEHAASTLRAELGIDAKPKLLLNVGRLHSQKNQKALVPIVASLLRTRDDFVMLIAGDGGLRAELEERITRHGLDHHIRLLGTRIDVPSLLHAADVFVLPSVHEGMSIAMLEAMASGTPVVASSVSPVSEFVRDGETGYLADPADPDSFAHVIDRVLDEPSTAHTTGSAARAYVREHFDIRVTSKQLEDLYLKLLSE